MVAVPVTVSSWLQRKKVRRKTVSVFVIAVTLLGQKWLKRSKCKNVTDKDILILTKELFIQLQMGQAGVLFLTAA